jgi:hypothetical protein
LKKYEQMLNGVDAALKAFYHERPGGLAVSVAWHLVGYSVGLLQAWFFFSLLTPNTSFVLSSAVWFLGMWFDLITFAVPVNIGVLEWSRIMVFKAVGGTALAGMTYGVALRIVQLFWAGFGLVNYAMMTSSRKPGGRAGEQVGAELIRDS